MAIVLSIVLVLVVAGLAVGAYLLWGRADAPSATASPSPTPVVSTATVSPSPTFPAEDRALARQLFDFRDCESGPRETAAVIAAVACRPVDPGPDEVLAMEFSTREAMDEYMEPSFPNTADSCGEGNYSGTWFYDSDPSDIRGQINCYVVGGEARVVWSHYSTTIVIVATGSSLPTIHEWWRNVAKPD